MMKMLATSLMALLLMAACRTTVLHVDQPSDEPAPPAAQTAAVPPPPAPVAQVSTAQPMVAPEGTVTVTLDPGARAVASDISSRLSQLPPTIIDFDRTLLDDRQKEVVGILIAASRDIDQIFFRQVSEDNPALRAQLESLAQRSDLHRDALQYFRLMYGRWDRLNNGEPFIAPFGEEGIKPRGAGYYPPDADQEELEAWFKEHPDQAASYSDLFTVIRRQGNGFVAVPYSTYYREFLEPAARKLREAAALTQNASLRNYLDKRADAFLSNDYYQSDLAWMDLDSDIEVVIGPYEVYEDSMNNYKAAFESFVTVVDRDESRKLAVYKDHLPAMERNLPIPDQYKNANRGTESPIKVVQQIFVAGDSRAGVQTSAFNLPNDERVREAKGSKKVLLKNVMDAKFNQSGLPISRRVLIPAQVDLVQFAPYFNHTLFHELSHGLGPGIITGPDGQKVEARLLLKDLYSTIEECKADVVGVWNILYAMDEGLITEFDRRQLYATYVGLMFRSMRFGLDEAHGRGTAIQWNWLRERGAIVPAADGRFSVDFSKMDEGVKSLANELLMIEALGDYDRGSRLLQRYGVSTPEIDTTIARLTDIPVDIAPVHPAAGESSAR